MTLVVLKTFLGEANATKVCNNPKTVKTNLDFLLGENKQVIVLSKLGDTANGSIYCDTGAGILSSTISPPLTDIGDGIKPTCEDY